MGSVSENYYTGEFLLGEADADRSRENITVAVGQDLAAGAVVAPVLAAAKDYSGATGTGTVGTVTFGAQVELGIYELECTDLGPGVAAAGTSAAGSTNYGNGTITASPATGTGCKVGVYRVTCIGETEDYGDFSVQDPDGIEIGIATVGAAFTTQLTFTIADGSNNFKGGDFFTITVAAANSGTWSVKTPSGLYLPDATTAVAYTSDHLGFTIADGGTDFEVGDVITLTVSEGNWTELDPDGTNGSQIAKGILYGPVDASTAAKSGVVISRDAVVQDAKLQWPTGITAGEKATARTQLLARGVVVRV